MSASCEALAGGESDCFVSAQSTALGPRGGERLGIDLGGGYLPRRVRRLGVRVRSGPRQSRQPGNE